MRDGGSLQISVVIPVYNRATIVLETLRSVARQSLKPTSLIVVDDGSKDDSADAVQSWFDHEGACLSGRVLRQFHNNGASVTRNVGFAGLGSTCDAVAFLDSDDIWPREFLETAAAALEREPDAAAAFADSVEIAGNAVLVRQVAHELCADPLSHIFGKECALLSCGLLRVSAVQQCRPFDPLLVTGQDIPFMIDLARQGRWLPLDCSPVERRQNLTEGINDERHLSKRFPDREMRWAAIYHRELTRLSPYLNRADTWQLRRYAASRWINAVYEAAQLGLPGQALICYAKALWLARPARLPRRTEQPLTELRFPCRRLVPRRVATYRTLFGARIGAVRLRLTCSSFGVSSSRDPAGHRAAPHPRKGPRRLVTRPAHPFALPPEDRALSPHTGWTRAHWEAVADGLLAAVAPYATPGGALYHLPGDRHSYSGAHSDGLEGYARTFLLAAIRVAGSRGDDPSGLLERYARGIAAGTERPGGDGREDWPLVTDRSQPLVEAASIAIALRLTRPWLWDRLDDGVRDRATAWLSRAVTAEPLPCNWVLFPATVGGFLGDRDAVARGLERIEHWYVGDGWYTDGELRGIDYYNGWALHFYPVLEAWFAADRTLLGRYGERLRVYLTAYARLFGGDGAPMHQGRSLTYRMATAAPLWLGALTGHTPLAPGTTRRLASGTLRHFLDRGAVGPDGLLSLGWYGPYDGVLQGYSGPASPYWASKGFLGLLLPPEHDVWTVTEEPALAAREDAVTVLSAPNWLLQSTAADGIVRLHNHGSEDARYDPHYTRLAYSTATGPVASPEWPDNHFGLLDAVGRVSARTELTPLGTGEGWAASRSSAGDTARVVSLVLARAATEVRVHLVTGARPGTRVRQTGWPAGEGLCSELLPLHGLSAAPNLPPARTAYTAHAVTPVMAGKITGHGQGDLFVSLARLTGVSVSAPLGTLAKVDVTPSFGARELTVTWADGAVHRARLRQAEVRVEFLPPNAR